jgi:hydrogenase nickel incorporation protein HypA/HybF
MHELSIAENILEIVHQYCPTGNGSNIQSVKLRVGELAGIVADSLTFCFSAITKGTSMEQASLVIERVPLTISCKRCNADSEIPVDCFACPRCHSTEVTIIAGRDLQVVEIELAEETNDHLTTQRAGEQPCA